MKIVQINTVCGTGSTGKIAVDLYNLSRNVNLEPYIAYGRGKAAESLSSFKIGNLADFGTHVLINFFQGKSGFGSKAVTRRFLQWLDRIQPDILHLHNLHGFYIHVGMLFDYIKANNIPVIWTFHDCWPITGQCAHFDSIGCLKWNTGCHDCPIYRTSYPYSLFKDNSRANYTQKKNTFTGVQNMTIVTPSHWLANLVKESFLKDYPVCVIPNGINLETFSSGSSVPTVNRKIILGVANVWTPQKGLSYFLELADLLDDSYQIVLVGLNVKQQRTIGTQYKGRITALTRTTNQTELADWYRRAYVYVNPTLEDNFPTTNLEALACGTPVITFRTGGSPESITSSCGIVVEKGNLKALADAIRSLDNTTSISAESCRSQALLYNKNKCFQEYVTLYHNILQ